jgi:hypothetical protein
VAWSVFAAGQEPVFISLNITGKTDEEEQERDASQLPVVGVPWPPVCLSVQHSRDNRLALLASDYSVT